MKIIQYQDFREVLKNALSERLVGNPQYSLRAFARDLGFSASQISHVLSGRKGLSPLSAEKIAKRMGWNESETEYFCSLVASLHSRSKTSKASAKKRVSELSRKQKTGSTPVELQMDAFRIISEWHHFPILELLKTKTKPTPRELAKRLNIQEIEVELALSRLERLELIKRTPKGFRVEQETVLPKENFSSDAVKKFHTQVMEKAKTALMQQAIEERYFRSECFPFKVKSVEKAQKDIRIFFENFVQEHSAVGDGEEIYALSTQFFRLTEKQK